jgi:peptidoglycan/LPS O-acetylase OafA/YrhL
MTTSAPTIAGRRDFPALSGARAVAAYSVVATHAAFQSGRSLGTQPLAGLLSRLDFGVTLFFLLSGFLLSRQFLADHRSLHRATLRTFWRRRFLRILPAYWVAVGVVLAVLTFVHLTAGDSLSYLFLLQTYNHHEVDPSLSQMWTLSVELTFYVALPLLLALGHRLPLPRRHRITGLIVLMMMAALAANLLFHAADGSETETLQWLPVYLDWFGLGIALASLTVNADDPLPWQRGPLRWAQSPGTCWIIGGLLLYFATLPLAGPRNLLPSTTWEWTIKHEIYGGAAFFLLLPLVAGTVTWPNQVLGNRVMRWLGEVSYGVYLWHLALLVWIQRSLHWQIFSGHFPALFGLTALAATAAAAVSWYLLERPLLRRFSTSWRRPSPPATPPPPTASSPPVAAATR